MICFRFHRRIPVRAAAHIQKLIESSKGGSGYEPTDRKSDPLRMECRAFGFSVTALAASFHLAELSAEDAGKGGADLFFLSWENRVLYLSPVLHNDGTGFYVVL